jgi:signal peptidase I
MDPTLKINTLRELWRQSSEQHWLPVQGKSMLPLLHEGDYILISHDLYSVQHGDILVFQQLDGLVAHRVVRIIKRPNHAPIYLTKGDNSNRFDVPLSDSEVLGKVHTIRKDGRDHDLTTPGWQFWNILLAVYNLLLGTLFQALRNFKQKLWK